ncbi:hypothetical protein [Aurantivibrio infirmus]
MNTVIKPVQKGPRTKGPITALVAKANILALIIGGLTIAILVAPAFAVFFLPYILNASVFWGNQKQGYIKVVIFANYAFAIFSAAVIFASIGFMLSNGSSNLLPWLLFFTYLFLFGIVLCFMSARKINRGYILQ